MSDLLRDAPVGQLIRWVTKCKFLKYPEEIPGFDCPNIYEVGKIPVSTDTTPGPVWPEADVEKHVADVEKHVADSLAILTRVATVEDAESPQSGETGAFRERTLSKIVTRPEMSRVRTRQDLEQAYMNATQEQSLRRQSQSIVPQKMADGIILVDWYATDDPENPQNWSSKKKLLVAMQIYIYTLAVYMGSAI
jgi:MFS transporter, DHA1 family, multidrug resistance protein